MQGTLGSLDVLGGSTVAYQNQNAADNRKTNRGVAEKVDTNGEGGARRKRYQELLRAAGVEMGIHQRPVKTGKDRNVDDTPISISEPKLSSTIRSAQAQAQTVDELEGLLKRLERLETKKERWAARAQKIIDSPELNTHTRRRLVASSSPSPLRYAHPGSPMMIPVPAAHLPSSPGLARNESAAHSATALKLAEHFRALCAAAQKRWLTETEAALFLLCLDDAMDSGLAAPPSVPYLPPRPPLGSLFLVDRTLAQSVPSLSYVQWREDGYAASASTEAREASNEVENEDSDDGLVSVRMRCESVQSAIQRGSGRESECMLERRAYRYISKSKLFCGSEPEINNAKRWLVQYAPRYTFPKASSRPENASPTLPVKPPGSPASTGGAPRRLLFRTVDPKTGRVYLYDPATNIVTLEKNPNIHPTRSSPSPSASPSPPSSAEENELPSSTRRIAVEAQQHHADAEALAEREHLDASVPPISPPSEIHEDSTGSPASSSQNLDSIFAGENDNDTEEEEEKSMPPSPRGELRRARFNALLNGYRVRKLMRSTTVKGIKQQIKSAEALLKDVSDDIQRIAPGTPPSPKTSSRTSLYPVLRTELDISRQEIWSIFHSKPLGSSVMDEIKKERRKKAMLARSGASKGTFLRKQQGSGGGAKTSPTLSSTSSRSSPPSGGLTSVPPPPPMALHPRRVAAPPTDADPPLSRAQWYRALGLNRD